MSDIEDAWGDAVYDAWRRGLDSDRVDRDRVADYYYETGDRYEAAEKEVDRLARAAEAAAIARAEEGQ